MSTAALLDGKGKNREEIESLEVAEDARELVWAEPSFAADLFMGKLRTKSVLPYPEQSDEDRKIGDEYMARVEAYLKINVDPDEIDEKGEIPDSVMKGYAELGLFGMKIPKEYGGLGFSQVNYNRTLALICSHCASSAALLSAHQSIGVPQPLRLFGTEEQKRKYLPRMAAGSVSAFALTEPEVGSDPARMTTTAVPTADGRHFIINGTKLWCTNGAIADTLVVMAQTPPIMKNGREKKQNTAFIVEKGMPGFSTAQKLDKLGMRGSHTGEMLFNNVEVPAANVLGNLNGGAKVLMSGLDYERAVLAAGPLGIMQSVMDNVIPYTHDRKQFGQSIGEFQLIQGKVADMYTVLQAGRAFCYTVGKNLDLLGTDHVRQVRKDCASVILWCAEKATWMAGEGIQIFGGNGYINDYPLGRLWRDAKLYEIGAGTSEIRRMLIGRELFTETM